MSETHQIPPVSLGKLPILSVDPTGVPLDNSKRAKASLDRGSIILLSALKQPHSCVRVLLGISLQSPVVKRGKVAGKAGEEKPRARFWVHPYI